MNYLPRMLQKLRKCKNQVPIKVPFYPHICPPWSPYPRSNFFVSKQSLDIYLESILMNYLPRMLQMLKKIRYFYSLFSENLRLAQNLPNEVFLTISDFKVDIPYTEILRISLIVWFYFCFENWSFKKQTNYSILPPKKLQKCQNDFQNS